MWQQVGLKVWSNLSSTLCLWLSSPFMARYQSELRGITRRSGVFSTCFSGVTSDHAPKWRACRQAMIWLILDHKSWFRSSQMNPPLGCSCTCYFFTLDREQSRTSVRGNQQSHEEQGAKAPGRSLSPNLSSCFCLILLFRSPRVALWKDGRHLVAHDLFDISVMVNFALLL